MKLCINHLEYLKYLYKKIEIFFTQLFHIVYSFNIPFNSYFYMEILTRFQKILNFLQENMSNIADIY